MKKYIKCGTYKREKIFLYMIEIEMDCLEFNINCTC